MSGVEVVIALVLLVGLLGILVPILPGVLLVLAAIVVWGFQIDTTTGWIVVAVAIGFLVVGTVGKYALPGRRLKEAGIPASTQWTGVAFGVVGFFVVPVLGLFLGFVLGMYVAERQRVGPAGAGPSTRSALRAVGLSILIELLSAGVAAVGTWAVGVVLT